MDCVITWRSGEKVLKLNGIWTLISNKILQRRDKNLNLGKLANEQNSTWRLLKHISTLKMDCAPDVVSLSVKKKFNKKAVKCPCLLVCLLINTVACFTGSYHHPLYVVTAMWLCYYLNHLLTFNIMLKPVYTVCCHMTARKSFVVVYDLIVCTRTRAHV